MPRYSQDLIEKVHHLRSLGKTYSEIKHNLKLEIPKSTLSEWCKNIILPPEYRFKIIKMNKVNLHKGRSVALVMNRMKRKKILDEIKEKNISIANIVHQKDIAKIALSMLCLGEASKSKSKTSSFYFGNSDPKIIISFIKLLMLCTTFDIEKIRCTVQCRADQDIKKLEEFWISITGIPARLFYTARIDSRTIGKPTKRKEYKGVLRIDYFDSKVWFDLESLSDLIYNKLIEAGPVA